MEVWKPVVGYEGLYSVSNLGRIASVSHAGVRRSKTGRYHSYIYAGRILRPQLINSGYLVVQLKHQGRRESHLVHRVVAAAFVENPENRPQVNHLDFDRTNNAASNLEWCTPKQNLAHSACNQPAKGHSVIAVCCSTGAVERYTSKSGAEMALLGKKTGIVSWAVKYGRVALGREWCAES